MMTEDNEKFKNWHEWVQNWSRNWDIKDTEQAIAEWKEKYIRYYFYEHFEYPEWYKPKAPKSMDVHYASVWKEQIEPLLSQKYEIIPQKKGRTARFESFVNLVHCAEAVATNVTFFINKKPGTFNCNIRKDIFEMLRENPVENVNFTIPFYDKFLSFDKKYCINRWVSRQFMRQNIEKETLEEIGFDNICGVNINFKFHIEPYDFRENRHCLFIYGEDNKA